MRPSTRRLLFLLLALALLAGAGRFVEPINAARQRDSLTVAPLDQVASPDLALPMLMAVGRAPVIDYLWLRATRLKDEGRYFDALQLSELICRLQPRFAPVWAFHAWNMAYNISVTQSSGEERWRWVKNGIELLRDRGIPLNPHSTQLYRELAWIHFHKLADYMDEKHWYYKNQFALTVEDILGAGDDCDWEALAAAPREWAELWKDPRVVALVERCRVFGTSLDQPGVLLGLLNQRAEARRAEAPPVAPSPVWEALDAPENAGAVRAVESYWRARRVRDELKLDPQRVAALRRAFGPLDFRLGEAHALYWANLGVSLGTHHGVRLDIQLLNTDRIQVYCLQNMVRRGRLVMSPEARKGVPPLLLPDTRFIPVVEKWFREISRTYTSIEKDKDAAVSMNFESAYNNFMRDAIVFLYEAGEMDEAQRWFDLMRRERDHPDFARGLQPFVMKTLVEEDVPTVYQALHRVSGFVRQSLTLLGYGRDREGLQFLKLARQVYDAYNAEIPNVQRTGLQSFEGIVQDMLDGARTQLPAEMYQRLRARFDRAAAAGGASSRPAALQGGALP